MTSLIQTLATGRGELGEKSGRELLSDRPTQYTGRCPLNTRRVAHLIHSTYRPVSGLLGKRPINLTFFWMIQNKLHHLCFFLNNIWIHQFAWVDTWNKIILAIVTLQGRYSLLDEYDSGLVSDGYTYNYRALRNECPHNKEAGIRR